MDDQILNTNPQIANMTSQELEQHIKHCGALMEGAMAMYQLSGCFGYKGEADGWRLRMEQAIAARSPAQVAALESERGLI